MNIAVLHHPQTAPVKPCLLPSAGAAPELRGNGGYQTHRELGAMPARRLSRQLCSRERGGQAFALGKLVASEEPPAAGTES